jgi:gas vesicle protein
MDNKSNSWTPFLFGALVGAAVGYLIASGKAEKWIHELKDSANRFKDELEKQLNDETDTNNEAHTSDSHG